MFRMTNDATIVARIPGGPRRRRRISLALSFVAALVSCGPSDGPPLPTSNGTPQLALCNAGNRMTVTTGSPPTIAWTPACVVGSVAISRVADGTPVWGVRTADGRATVTGPLTYGVVPAGLIEMRTPEPLSAGTSYRIILIGPDLGGFAALLAVATFSMP